MKPIIVALMLALTLADRVGEGPHFYHDDPVWQDQDRVDTPVRPNPIELSDYYDALSHTFHRFGDEESGEAENVNTLDEAPDSTWFTNRHGRRRLSIAELVRGPGRGEGPDPSRPWTIVGGKSQGRTAGFQIQDAEGATYLIKLDNRRAPELASAAEVIVTRIFYAIGYHVPENTVVHFDPEQLQIHPEARLTDRFGDAGRFTRRRLRRLLREAQRDEHGRVRALASKFLPGQPLGPFRYYGTRSDDPNDVIDHENRRELRGLRVFSAWLNHDDARAQNTLDTWVEEDGKHFVRHHLIDFGSALGSGTVDLQLPNLGFHYFLDMDLIGKSARGFGLHVPYYRKVRWPEETRLTGVGRFESKYFQPEQWKPDYPNPAFERLTARDGFWAAKILMRFTREELEAIVATGRLSDPRASAYLLETIRERQMRTGAYYLNRLPPLDEFRVTGSSVQFTNLAERYQLGPAGSVYQTRWSVFNNLSGSSAPLTPWARRSQTEIPLPEGRGRLGPDELLLLAIDTRHPQRPEWEAETRVFLRSRSSTWEIVGLQRDLAALPSGR